MTNKSYFLSSRSPEWDPKGSFLEVNSCQPEQLLENARQGLARLTIK
jgi:hypothetical protein